MTRSKYSENFNAGGLTVSHKIRNSSLQPYKNKLVNTEDKKNGFGAMIQGSTLGKSN
jgi:hypothetical protein